MSTQAHMRNELTSKPQHKHQQFKQLLEYFVAHLEWCNSQDDSSIGYNQYIKPLLDTKKFKYAGQGWNGEQIQKQIEQWDHYENYRICINIYAPDYQSKACYLNWKGTWINVRPLWENSHIVKLYLSKEEKSSAKEEKTETIKELGLFDNKEPNSTIKVFFDDFEKMILEHNGMYYNKLMMAQIESYTQIIQHKKNLILQGAPGTGKTFNTAALALSICKVADVDLTDHQAVMQRYKQLQDEGRIGFCTFHQSMDYEDFVEGIKPNTENETVSYDVEDGIFKQIADRARENWEENKENGDIIIEKKHRTIDVLNGLCEKIQREIDENSYADLFLNNKSKMKIFEIFTKHDKIKTIRLKNSTLPNTTSTVGLTAEIILRDYEQYTRGEIKSYKDIKPYHGNTFYYFELYKRMAEYEKTMELPQNDDQKPELQNYVLIIDEINRGNVSRIFGELITLLEADKRLGGEHPSDHPIEVTLPYSKVRFGVPKNLYIVGTMNTTDRSVGNIDYAVRRRFAFATLKADRQILVGKYGEDAKQVQLFDKVSEFLNDDKKHIDMDFEDLMVGHSYFMANNAEELKLKLEYEIIPLIEEYQKDGIINVKKEELGEEFENWRSMI